VNNQPINTTEAQQDAQAIFSLLDGLVGDADPVNSDAPLTQAEQDKLAMFLGEPAPVHSDPSLDSSPPNGPKGTSDLGLNTLGDEIDGLFSQLQNQLETVIAQHASLSDELEATRSRIETQETTSKTKASEVISSPNVTNAEDIRPVLDKITHWRTLFANQFQHLLTLAQDSMTQQQQLEAALARANQAIQKLQNQLDEQPTAKQKNNKTITTLRAELSEQKNLLSATQVRFQEEESNREQVRHILRQLRARLKKKPGVSAATTPLETKPAASAVKPQLKKKPAVSAAKTPSKKKPAASAAKTRSKKKPAVSVVKTRSKKKTAASAAKK